MLLVFPMPVSIDSWNRNHWLVDISLPEEGGYSLSLSGIAPKPDSSGGVEVCIPYLQGEHATGTDVFLQTVQLNRITLQESALPFQVWAVWNTIFDYIISVEGGPCISIPGHWSFIAPIQLLTPL